MSEGYVGITFRDGGRDRGGCDCWGLVRLMHLEEAGIELPSYGEIGSDELLAIARTMAGATSAGDVWRRVDEEPRRRLDVVVMKGLDEAARVPVHVGVMLDGKRMLHTERHVDSHSVLLDHPSVRSRIVGIYRHRSLS